jgi:hypothetical protein
MVDPADGEAMRAVVDELTPFASGPNAAEAGGD